MSHTRLDWIRELSSRSSTVAALNLASSLADESYWEATDKHPLNAAAFNLSGCPDHNAAIVRWVDDLASKGASKDQLRKLITDLTSRSTYGTFSELAAYGMLLDNRIPFSIQVPATGRDILNPNGSELDGRMDLSGSIYFDVKAFGLQDYLIEQLRERAQKHFKQHYLAIQGTSAMPLADLEDLLGKGSKDLIEELGRNSHARRGGISLVLRPLQQVQTTIWSQDPYSLAEHNAEYAFKFAKQFARRKPFILVFVLHPWLGGFNLTVNFAHYAEQFTRAFGRRTFFQFKNDRKTRLYGVTRASASRLLSGVMFVNAWAGQSQHQDKTTRLFLNPRAKNPVSELDRHALENSITGLAVDDFRHDTY